MDANFYYIFDSCNYGLEKYSTKAEWLDAIKNYDFLGRFCDDGWGDEVWNVVAGIAPSEWSEDMFESDENYPEEQDFYEKYATHGVEKILIQERPDETEIDEDGYDDEGTYWGDYIEICDFAFKENTPTPTREAGEEI